MSIWDTAQSVLDTFGISGDSAAATATALLEPSLSNIQKVTAAFQAEGTTPPPELMNELYSRYYAAIAANPVAASGAITQTITNAMPYIIALGLAYFLFKGKN